jgi:hypothetical protein
MSDVTLRRKRFRSTVGDPDGAKRVFGDDEIDDCFAEAEEMYPGAAEVVIRAQAAIIGFRRLLANQAKFVSYSQNAASEQLSDVFRHIERLIQQQETQRDEALSNSGSTVLFASIEKHPPRYKEYPDA